MKTQHRVVLRLILLWYYPYTSGAILRQDGTYLSTVPS